jgi:hypothetical protein
MFTNILRWLCQSNLGVYEDRWMTTQDARTPTHYASPQAGKGRDGQGKAGKGRSVLLPIPDFCQSSVRLEYSKSERFSQEQILL